MIYVQRNEEGVIVGVFAYAVPGVAEEPMQEDDPEVIEFFNRGPRDV